MTTIPYRPDIDGLRAVAVLAVIAFHAYPNYLPGGFIGVDMFFVISGYLISGIIHKACQDGTFSAAEFYARRVRRIFPALLAAVTLCLLYGWLVLLPAEYEQLGGHAAFGTLFLQNVLFWRENGYFDTAASLKPLLHLWSLAVEEQIYLILPPAVLFIRWKRWAMEPVLAALLGASFAANLFMANRSVSTDFFLLPFRAWEFLAGGILAVRHHRHGPPSGSSLLREAASCCGVLAIAAGLMWINDRQPYPGWRAVVPVAGTLLVIAAGRSATPNRWILSTAPLVWVGLISYPLYLFHWPAISYVYIVGGPKPGAKAIAAAVGLSVMLAMATYYGLERQIRHSRWRWTVPVLIAGFLALGGAGIGIRRGTITPRPVSREVQQVNAAVAEKKNPPGYARGYRSKKVRGILHDSIGGKGPQTLFLGDSFMLMYTPRLRELLHGQTGPSRGAIFITLGGACPIPGVHRADRPECDHLLEVVEEELRINPAIDRVVIAARWRLYFKEDGPPASIDGFPLASAEGRDRAVAAFDAMISRLATSGKHVHVVLAVPEGPELDPSSMVSRSFLAARTLRSRTLTVGDFQRRYEAPMGRLAAVAVINGADIIDPVPLLTRDGICTGTNEDGPIRCDSGHLRVAFVRKHVTYLDATVADDATTSASAAIRVPHSRRDF